MGKIIKMPVQASKLGFRRVKRRVAPAEHPDQLDLFPGPGAQILHFAPDLSPFEQALLWDERGDLRAAELYSRAIDQQDCVADAFCNLGIIESQNGNRIRAFDCFTASLKHDPRHSESHYNLGNLYFDLNDFRLAQIHYEIAVEVDPGFANAYFNLALVQALKGDLGGAVRSLGRYQQLVPEEEGRIAGQLLEDLRRSLPAAKSSGIAGG
jgi:tetratricopeptide (TPR) repeat protein